ncbi:MAG: arylsulfatase [Acidobacteriota bacterium]
MNVRMGRGWSLKTLGLSALVLSLGGTCVAPSRPDQKASQETPNIVYILADDLGYGDLSCLNTESKIPTPNMDRLAADGMIFTDAHAGSAVCTPTRYGILTGRYAWRTRLKHGVLWGYSPRLIEPERMTVASLLKQHGYSTACVGKWHLGLDWHTADGKKLSDRSNEPGETVDFSKPVSGGPTDLGFDYFFGIPASLDMYPYLYIENDRVVELPSLRIEASERGKGGFWRAGPIAPGFKHIEVLPTIAEKAVGFIERHLQNSPDKPFFLYFPLTAPHTPVLPTEAFLGKSKAGKYGDFVVEVDWTVGQIVETVERLGISDNTLIIVTSDNGPERHMQARKKQYNHYSSYHFRGMKRDAWDGGHRIPFIVRWPGRIKPGSRTNETICLTDLMATVAEILGVTLPQGAGEDSYSILPAMLGKPLDSPMREATVHHSSRGEFAIRQGDWKLITCQGSGGNNYDTEPNAIKEDDPPMQLYNMAEDVGERKNLFTQNPEMVEHLSRILDDYKTSSRSTSR